jgi:hypothetical protein
MNGYIAVARSLNELRNELRNYSDSQILFERDGEYFVLIGDVKQYNNILPSIQRYHSGDVQKEGSGAIFDTGYYEIIVSSFRTFEENAFAVMMILDSMKD